MTEQPELTSAAEDGVLARLIDRLYTASERLDELKDDLLRELITL